MKTQCTAEQLQFHALGRREVTGRFDGGRITTDGGGLLLRETDRRIGLLDRLAGCFTDHRNAQSVEHDVYSLVAQRVYGVALGYEDLNDHDVLRDDSTLAVLVGKRDVLGTKRVRERDRGRPLAGSSTLNRLELGTAEGAGRLGVLPRGADELVRAAGALVSLWPGAQSPPGARCGRRARRGRTGTSAYRAGRAAVP